MRLDKCMKNACLTLIFECVKTRNVERDLSFKVLLFVWAVSGLNAKSLQTIVLYFAD